MHYASSLVWFRRDLRCDDHAALYHALTTSDAVYCVFVFDTEILDTLEDKFDRRVEFIWESVRDLKSTLQKRGGDLLVLHGKAVEKIHTLATQLKVDAVFCNRDYEPAANRRDAKVAATLAGYAIQFHHYKDQVLFEQDEILNQSGKPYSVFTPYKNAHLKQLNAFYLAAYPIERHMQHLAKVVPSPLLMLEDLGFARTNLHQLRLPTGMSGAASLFEDFKQRIQYYQQARDFPAVKGVSYLSVHLRFGTISIRQLAREAWQMGGVGAQTWLNELIWRDFYFQILYHHPHLAEGYAFKAEFEHMAFENSLSYFHAWCDGRTGFPLVDAAMRQLNQTGYMHNRLRMVTASFLVKDLLIDWRWGERYFAQKLIDFDFAANNGGWQWAASTGCDAQPWFRIFNPVAQSKKFDPEGKFIRKYVPELSGLSGNLIHAPWHVQNGVVYSSPIVIHEEQRKKVLNLYKKCPE